MSEKLKIGVAGCAGKVGKTIVRELLSGAWPDMELVGGTIQSGDKDTPDGLFTTKSVEEIYAKADALIDFTSPNAVHEHAAIATANKKILVVGTSGLTQDDKDILLTAAGEARIVYSSNMSLGVNLLFGLAEKAASVLGDDWDAEILDLHHKYKVDAPSGTSYSLAKAVCEGRGHDAELTLSRKGFTGARNKGNIGFSVQRGGDVVAENSLIFFGQGERLELTHKASDRAIFAKGALTAARWVANKEAGFYSMADVLGLS